MVDDVTCPLRAGGVACLAEVASEVASPFDILNVKLIVRWIRGLYCTCICFKRHVHVANSICK